MAQSVKGKTAIVTGAGSGINFCFARLLLSKGCNVLIADLSLRPEAQALVNAHSSGTPRAVFLRTDVTSWPQLSAMFTTATKEFGSIDIVCPGAGVYEPPFSNFWSPPGQPPSRDDPMEGSRYALLDINLTHPIRATQLAISHFLAQKPRCEYPANVKTVVHISSIAGQVTPLAAPLYNAGKHAINGFVRSLAQLEQKIGIRVAAVAPGVIRTPIWTDHPEKLKAVEEGKDEWVEPEEVAEAMLALVEEDRVKVGGQGEEEIEVKGGTILEVSKGRVRDVKAFNDPGPVGRPGNTATGMGKLEDEVWGALATEEWGRL